MKTYQEVMDKINEIHAEADEIDFEGKTLKESQSLIIKLEKLTAQAGILVWVITNTKLSEI